MIASRLSGRASPLDARVSKDARAGRIRNATDQPLPTLRRTAWGSVGSHQIHHMRVADLLLIAWANATVDVLNTSTIGSH
jgi:hypothetical protein